MYQINPRRLYAMEWAMADERNVRRMEAMVRAMGREPSEVRVIAAEELPDVIRENGWIGEVRQGAYEQLRDPDFIFNAFRWVSDAERGEIMRSDLFRQCVDAHRTYGDCKQGFTGSRVLAMMGAAPINHFEKRPEWNASLVCWSLHDIHSAWGCVHRCAYCQRGSVYVINLNLEEYVERVDRLLEENPWQKTIRYDVEQDVLAIEPEYGACELLVNHFARKDDRYLILFSKSANVDHLLSLDHRGKTIMLWTLCTRTVSRRYEAKTGSMEQRIEAAVECREAGYPVRFKCKPVIPIRGWREETTEMLEMLYSRVQPENLSIEMVFFDSVAEMDATLGLKNLDPEFVEAAREAEARYAGAWRTDLEGQKPFPFEVKEAVYRHLIGESRRLSPETPVTLCAETQRMWDTLSDLVGYQAHNYVCNCGPLCTPGLKRIENVQGPDAVRIAERAAACV